MADLIQIKGGNGDVPSLQDRELAIRKDTKELFCGVDGEKIRLCGADDIARLEQLIGEIKSRLDELAPSE